MVDRYPHNNCDTRGAPGPVVNKNNTATPYPNARMPTIMIHEEFTSPVAAQTQDDSERKSRYSQCHRERRVNTKHEPRPWFMRKQSIRISRCWNYRSRNCHNWFAQYQTVLDISVVKAQSWCTIGRVLIFLKNINRYT